MKPVTVILMLALLAIPLTGLKATTVSEVEKHLMCTCGCTMPLYTCECGTSTQMRNQIQGFIDKGMDKDQIISLYVSQYGEIILSAPTKSGFNLLAWIIPFVALFSVGAILYKALRRWSVSNGNATPEAGLSSELQARYNKQLEEELSQFEEGEVV